MYRTPQNISARKKLQAFMTLYEKKALPLQAETNKESS